MEDPDPGLNALNRAVEPLHAAILDQDRASALRLLPPMLWGCRLGAEDLRAVWHPTGFLVVRLWELTGRSVRLHVWPRGERVVGDPCWLVHDHVWSFRSLVLQGEIVNHEYVVAEARDAPQSVYEVEYLHGTISRMTKRPQLVAVSAASSTAYGAGESYGVPSRRFHATSVSQDVWAATLVATWRESAGNPFVIGPTDGPASIEVNRMSISPDATRRLIEEVFPDL